MAQSDNTGKQRNIINGLLHFFKKYPNRKKQGALSEMLKRDDYHNKNQSEDEYQREQKEWIDRINTNKKTD